jgi:hypothetical protein
MTRGGEASGVLIVRAWVEDGPEGLRARITQTRDVTSAVRAESVVTSVSQVMSAVHDWLEALLLESA